MKLAVISKMKPDGIMSEKIEFDAVFKEYRHKILHYVKRLAGETDAEDIVQEVFEKAGRGLDGFKGESKISTWLYRIATNTALDKMRSSIHKHETEELRPEAEDTENVSISGRARIDQSLIRKEMSDCVREYIERLSPEYKTVIILSELEGFKNREIAEILQVSVDTVKIRLHRARTKLKKELDEGCEFYHNEQNIFACDRKDSGLIEFKQPPKK
jgi:RNA polymerase sigma-70 factor (ECF subfamily)